MKFRKKPVVIDAELFDRDKQHRLSDEFRAAVCRKPDIPGDLVIDAGGQAQPHIHTLECWAIVEAMGFKKYAGHVTTQELAGSSFIRVDVPESATAPEFSKLIGAGSIYMITPTDEATARKAAAVLARGESPLPVYIPPEPKQLRRR